MHCCAERPEAFEAFFMRFLGPKAERVLHAHKRLTYLLLHASHSRTAEFGD